MWVSIFLTHRLDIQKLKHQGSVTLNIHLIPRFLSLLIVKSHPAFSQGHSESWYWLLTIKLWVSFFKTLIGFIEALEWIGLILCWYTLDWKEILFIKMELRILMWQLWAIVSMTVLFTKAMFSLRMLMTWFVYRPQNIRRCRRLWN